MSVFEPVPEAGGSGLWRPFQTRNEGVGPCQRVSRTLFFSVSLAPDGAAEKSYKALAVAKLKCMGCVLLGQTVTVLICSVSVEAQVLQPLT